MAKPKRTGRSGRAVLIYDGNCPVCSRTVDWIRENERKGSFEMLPCQAKAVRERYPDIRKAECMEAMHLVLSDGTVLAGERAVPEILKRLKKYSPAAELFKLPGSGMLSRAFYRWFADRRYHIADLLFHGKGKDKE